jgi:hypothetical protein
VPKARRCQGCGATLGEADEAGVLTCRFCGLTHDATTILPAGNPVVVQISPDVRRASRVVWAVVVVVVLVIVASALVPAVMGLWIAKSAIEQTAVPDVLSRLNDYQRPIAPADLASLPMGGGWKVLQVPPPTGGFDDFDPVASLPWAMQIGRAWASDAVLTRIDVGKVSASGVVDLSGEQSSGYRFLSPARRERLTNETDSGSKGVTASGLMIEIKGNQVRALPHEEHEDRVPPAAASLPLPAILERARESRGFVDKPYYAGYLIHLPREGWVWYFRPVAGSTGLPRVRARDGRSYPY